MRTRTCLAAVLGTILASAVLAVCVLAYRGIVHRATSSTLAGAEVVVPAASVPVQDQLPDPAPDDPGFTAADVPGFVREMNARLTQVAGRIDRLRGTPPEPSAHPAVPGGGEDHAVFVHIYAYFGRVCDGLHRLQLVTSDDAARRVRYHLVVDYLAALKGVQLAEDDMTGRRAEPPERGDVGTSSRPGGPVQVTDTTTPGADSRSGVRP